MTAEDPARGCLDRDAVATVGKPNPEDGKPIAAPLDLAGDGTPVDRNRVVLQPGDVVHAQNDVGR